MTADVPHLLMVRGEGLCEVCWTAFGFYCQTWHPRRMTGEGMRTVRALDAERSEGRSKCWSRIATVSGPHQRMSWGTAPQTPARHQAEGTRMSMLNVRMDAVSPPPSSALFSVPREGSRPRSRGPGQTLHSLICARSQQPASQISVSLSRPPFPSLLYALSRAPLSSRTSRSRASASVWNAEATLAGQEAGGLQVRRILARVPRGRCRRLMPVARGGQQCRPQTRGNNLRRR